MRRYIETLFRRKGIFLTPLLVTPFVALAVWAMMSSGQQEVAATLWVEPSPLAATAPEASGRSDLSPNAAAAEVLSEWVATEAFRQEVLEASGMDARVREGGWPRLSGIQVFSRDTGLDSIPLVSGGLRMLGLAGPASQQQAMGMALRSLRDDVTIAAEGAHLLSISYMGNDAGLGAAIVNSVINVYQAWSTERRTEAVAQAVAIQTQQVELQEQRVQASGDRVNAFLAANPAPRMPAVEAEAERLRRAYELEQEVHADALRRLSDLRMDGEASISSGAFSMHVVDPAQPPTESGTSVRVALMMVFLGVIIGGGIGVAAIAAITWADGTVRNRQDIAPLGDGALAGEIPWKQQHQDGPHMAWLLARNAKA